MPLTTRQIGVGVGVAGGHQLVTCWGILQGGLELRQEGRGVQVGNGVGDVLPGKVGGVAGRLAARLPRRRLLWREAIVITGRITARASKLKKEVFLKIFVECGSWGWGRSGTGGMSAIMFKG